ncbi:MAG: recombinase family protein [Bacteroidota bacterium]
MRKAIIYTRVSTSRQEVDRQISELELHAKRNEFEIVEIFCEKISGKLPIHRRRSGKAFMNFIKANDIDIVLVSEVSRLGRSAIDVQKTIDYLTNELKVNIYIHQQSMYLLDENKEYRAMSKMFVDILANFAQMESEILSSRIKSGQAEARKRGRKEGRPKGSIQDNKATLSKYPKVQRELKNGLSLRKVAKLCDVSVNTVIKVREAMAA